MKLNRFSTNRIYSLIAVSAMYITPFEASAQNFKTLQEALHELWNGCSTTPPVQPRRGSHSHSNTLSLPRPVESSDYYNNGQVTNPSKVELGRFLFFDKILSGNQNIACATCHHPLAGTSDDLSLSVGEGANGLGRDRNLGIGGNAVHERIPRSSPAIFNIGAREFKTMFHDGRVESKSGRITSPVGKQMPGGLDNVLAVQAMLPVTSLDEMAGQIGENEVANAAARNKFAGPGGVWDILTKRIQSKPAYVSLFKSAYPGKVRRSSDITFVQVANALAAFEAFAFRTDNSPFDQYLRGNTRAMSSEAHRGMHLFYGKAKCATCHSGKFQTDHKFHSIAMPQIGPGKGDGYKGQEDYGRERVTKNRSDRYKFRTPSLRNVTETGPWGHTGAYTSLEEVVLHHLHPEKMLHRYNPDKAFFPSRRDLDAKDDVVHNNATIRNAIAKSNELTPQFLTPSEISELIAFLHSLTDQRAVHPNEAMVPTTVPSGLPVSDYVNYADPGHNH